MVSIILPNYNHAKYLSQRIDTILKQSFQDFELIILDDCSTDNSKEIIEQYRSHPKVSHILYNDLNSGSTFNQWKKGIYFSNGEYIWIAESDDYCESTLLAELVTPMLEDETIKLSFCQSLLISAENDTILDRTHVTSLTKILDGKTFVKEHLFVKNEILNASMVVFKKEALPELTTIFTEMKYCGDWMLWVNICLKGKVYVSGKYLNYYRRHNHSTITNATRNGLDFLEGNQIFKIIESSIEISADERKLVLNEKLNSYLYNVPFFKNAEVLKDVNNSMLELDPSFTIQSNQIILQKKPGNYFLKIVDDFFKKLSFIVNKLYENSTH